MVDGWAYDFNRWAYDFNRWAGLGISVNSPSMNEARYQGNIMHSHFKKGASTGTVPDRLYY